MGELDFRICRIEDRDLEAAAMVEAACFPPAEAADPGTLKSRAAVFPESFLVAKTERVVGLVNGCVTTQERITDGLFADAAAHRPDGMYQAVFGLAVLPEYQRYGIGKALMRAFCSRAREAGRQGVILTCKDRLIVYYETLGFQKLGLSASVHGGATWYDMLLRF